MVTITKASNLDRFVEAIAKDETVGELWDAWMTSRVRKEPTFKVAMNKRALDAALLAHSRELVK